MSGTKIKYSLPELKQIVKENNIKGTSLMNKPEILKLLVERGLIPVDALAKPVKIVKEIDPKYEFTKSIRNKPKMVLVVNYETGEYTTYPSIYRAGRALGCAPKIIRDKNGKIWKEIYGIEIFG